MQIGVDSARAVDNKRIFVIDNDEITRAVLQFMLHDENETHELADMDAALAKARDWKPDLLMIGTSLLVGSGADSIRTARERLPHAKILIVADTLQDPLAQAALSCGANGILPKPLRIEAVRRKVDIMLGRRTALSIPVALA